MLTFQQGSAKLVRAVPTTMRPVSQRQLEGAVTGEWPQPDDSSARQYQRSKVPSKGMPLTRRIVGLNMFAICAFMVAVIWVQMNGHRAPQNAEARPLSEASLIAQTIVAELTMRRQNPEAQSLNQSLGATLSGVKLSKDLAIGLFAPDLTWQATRMAPERAGTDSLSGLDQTPILPVLYSAAGLFRTQFSKPQLPSPSVAALLQEAVGDAKEGVSLHHGWRMSDQGPFHLVTAGIFLNNVLVGQVAVGDLQTDLEHRHRQVLENYLQIFVVLTLAILVFSVRLATTISARISSLPAAVEASGTAEWENKAKPCALLLDLSQRSDEIGRLSAALRGMVAALYGRIEANEKFAGEVAHEIKNPLASLRATVGAFAIAKSGPERQQLFNVIDHDVLRIDRRVNDISTASKLDNDLLKDQESEFELVPMISRLSQYFE